VECFAFLFSTTSLSFCSIGILAVLFEIILRQSLRAGNRDFTQLSSKLVSSFLLFWLTVGSEGSVGPSGWWVRPRVGGGVYTVEGFSFYDDR
jgi:hypothetical protein